MQSTMTRPPLVLVVDDDPATRRILQHLLDKEGIPCCGAPDVSTACLVLSTVPISCVILDLILPSISGIQFLPDLVARWPETAVVLHSVALSTPTMAKALQLGVAGFIEKPTTQHDLITQLRSAMAYHQKQTETRHRLLQADQEITALKDALHRQSEDEVECLLEVLAIHDPATVSHSRRVAKYSALLALRAGWLSPEVDRLAHAALLHDIGKVHIPKNVLLSNATLTHSESRLIQRHTIWGERICSQSSSPIMQMAADIALHHHERWDGLGYPTGAAGGDIPESARIVAIADAYDAMTADRNYRPALPVAVAIKSIQSDRQTQFDPALVDLFIELQENELLVTQPQTVLVNHPAVLVNHPTEHIEPATFEHRVKSQELVPV